MGRTTMSDKNRHRQKASESKKQITNNIKQVTDSKKQIASIMYDKYHILHEVHEIQI